MTPDHPYFIWLFVLAQLVGFVLCVAARDYSLWVTALRDEIHKNFGAANSVFSNPPTPRRFQCYPLPKPPPVGSSDIVCVVGSGIIALVHARPKTEKHEVSRRVPVSGAPGLDLHA